MPTDSRLEIEAMVSNRDIGFVHQGQEAEIKIDTFNFTRYGLLHGQVLTVWRAVPSLTDWLIATMLWTGTGLLALWGAASRHRERRRH